MEVLWYLTRTVFGHPHSPSGPSWLSLFRIARFFFYLLITTLLTNLLITIDIKAALHNFFLEMLLQLGLQVLFKYFPRSTKRISCILSILYMQIICLYIIVNWYKTC